ncbi:MAG: ABC transporter permease, partial [Candidatus Competibacteraceae bacterium]|nr:ABC transporter permease [Candidatus Competibacteraceae bacterium]
MSEVWLRRTFFSVILLFMSAPLIVVTGVSLNAQKRLLFPPDGLSLRWYGELLQQQEWLTPLYHSVLIAALAA